MPIQLIVQLLTIFGPSAVQLIDTLITKWQANGIVTAAEWADLKALLKQTSQDQMAAMLTKAGIALDDPHAVALLALEK